MLVTGLESVLAFLSNGILEFWVGYPDWEILWIYFIPNTSLSFC
jgi:hypothetical protein